jgi:hypothetical protein
MRKIASALAVSMTLFLAAGVVFTGCDREGPAERVGEKIDRNDSGVKDKLTPDQDGEKAGKKIDRALGSD